uniref:Uncharacterized protein LOC104232508 n=1 Tax=Nicotiana sylvestris TaxID=4096 RepID=A0A1U7XC58_NICSY|nr:PREDICTED: uncharacterized protein LOC104232508 [Nicotiana sylvestris]
MDMRSALQLSTRLVATQAQRQVGISVGHINRDVAVQWYETWESSRGTNASPAAYAQNLEDRKRQQYENRDGGQRKKARYARRPEDFSGNLMSPYPVESIRQLQKPYYEGSIYSESRHGSRILGFQNWIDSTQMRAPPPRCSQCGRAHSGQCRQESNVCYTCGDPSHYMRDCPINGRSGMVQPTRSITVSFSLVRPQERGPQASTGRGRGRSGASSSGGSQNRIYALPGRQDLEATPDDMAGIVISGNVRSY